MNKKCFKRLLILWFFILIALSVFAFSSTPLETSVVSLYINESENTIVADHFFEIIDQGEHILLPLTSFSEYIGINLEFSNVQQIITMSSKDKMVKISVDDNMYLEHPEWSEYLPLSLDDVYYVAPQVFEYLSDLTVLWEPLFQQISVSLNNPSNWLDRDQEKDANDSTVAGQYDIYHVDSKSGINLIRYQLRSTYAMPQRRTKVDVDWEIFGKIDDFSLAATINTNFINANERTANLKSIRAKYETPKHLLVLGDHESVWEESLDKKVVRGLTYSFSKGIFSKSIAYKNFQGELTPSSAVSLYVNNQLVASLNEDETKDGSYNFLAVPLKANQLNYVRIVIREPSGEFVENHYRIAGDPRIYLPGTVFFQTAHGIYRTPTRFEFEGRTHAFTLRVGGGDYSILSDWVWLKQEDRDPNSVIRTSLLAQPFSNFLLDANSYLAPSGASYSLGGSVGLKFFYANLIGMAKVYAVPDDIAKVFPQGTGTGTTFSLIYAPSLDWSFEAQATNRYVLGNDMHHSRYLIGAGKVLSNPAKSLMSLRYARDNYQYHTLKRNFITNSFEWRFREKTETTLQDKAFIFEQNNIYSDAFSEQIQRLEVSASGSDMLGRWGIVSHKFSYQNSLAQGMVAKQSLNVLTSIKATKGKSTGYISLGLTSSTNSENEKNFFGLTEYNLRLIYDKLIKENLHLTSNITRNYKKDGTKDILELNVSLTSNFSKTNLKTNVQYLINVSGSKGNSLSGTAELQKVLDNGLSLIPKFNLSVSYPSKQLSYYIGLDLSQSLSLAAGRTSFLPYSNQDPKSYITGTVYLDLNENNVFDKGEPVVPDIPVRLDNNIVETDENGYYEFEAIDHGEFILSIDLYSLPADYTPLVEPKLVILKEFESASIDLPLIIRGSISGRVFLDLNNNGIFDGNDTPLPFATVILNGEKKTLTKESGQFLFDRIKLGSTTLSIAPESLPGNTEVHDVKLTLNSKLSEVYNILVPVTVKK